MIGRTIGHYRIVEKLGAGGMGVVYRARDQRLERDVALKLLPTGTLAEEPVRKRFRKEALTLSKLNHPHIATVHDFDTQEDVDFLVMEYVAGRTLAERLREGALPEKEVARIGTQVAEALNEAHDQGVVHRDLKPGNIAFTPKGQVKVLDFGIAKLLRPSGAAVTTESLTLSLAVAGTLPYMAPEQLQGAEVDGRADIYALGSVLYEMATGRQPFITKEPTQLIAAILQQPVPAPRNLSRQVSPELERIILKCLEKDAANRYQSAKELAVDLRHLAAPSTIRPAARHQAPAWGRRLQWAAPVVLLAVLIGFNVGGLRQRLFGADRPKIDSLAVLPLKNLMNDPEQDYFVEGMTEALITQLSKIRALKVISRTSVMQYKNANKPLPEIARELNVKAVVEGSVLRVGDRVRVTAQLIDASTDTHLWADNYDRELHDILGLQSDVARAISRQIRVAVTRGEQDRLANRRPVNPAAHEAYLKGDYYWNKFTGEGFLQSVKYFQQAIEIDRSYAPAYAGLAQGYTTLGVMGGSPPQEAFPKAKKAALKALELDETLARAHIALGMVRMVSDWDWTGAEGELKRAIELNPGEARYFYGVYLARMGRSQEAVAEMKRARELDPLSLRTNGALAWALFLGRHYDQAIEQARSTMEMDPNYPMAHWVLGSVYGQTGMLEEAIAELQQAVASSGTPLFKPTLAHLYAVAGKKGEARKLLAELRTPPGAMYVSPTDLAMIHVGLAEEEQALALLEKAYQVRDPRLALSKILPQFDPLRESPRFQELLRQMNFPE